MCSKDLPNNDRLRYQKSMDKQPSPKPVATLLFKGIEELVLEKFLSRFYCDLTLIASLIL